jgi:Tfp pilus assembly protein PilO
MNFRPGYLWALLPVIVVIGWVIGFYGVVSSKSSVKERELAATMAEKLVLEKEVGRLLTLRKREGEAISKMDSMSASIPRYADLPAFMKEIVHMAKAKGVFVEDLGSIFSPVEDQKPKPVVNPSFEIVVKGRYLQIGAFLEELAANKAFKGVQKASLSYDEARYPVLTGRFQLQFKARR